MNALRSITLLVLVSATVVTASAQQPAISVRYRSADTVYLDKGSAAGLAVGDIVEILRGSGVIARLEVIYVAANSASCRIISESTPVAAGDKARIQGDRRPAPPPSPPAAPAGTPDPLAISTTRSTSISGSATVDAEHRGGLDEEPGSRAVGRLNLRARNIAGTPLQARVRLRLAQEGDDGDDSRSHHRLYEAALIYEPVGGRFAARAGRIGTAPFAGVGYVDGILAEVRPAPSFSVGAFGGRIATINESGAGGTKYGAFVRMRPQEHRDLRGAELTIAGVRQTSDDPRLARDYLAVEARLDRGEWSFFETAEIDVASDDDSAASGLTNAALTAVRRFEAGHRLSASYHRQEDDPLDEVEKENDLERFQEFLHQGLRVSYQHSFSRRWSAGVFGGLHSGETTTPTGTLTDERTTSAGIEMRGALPLSLSLSFLAQAFQSEQFDGVTAQFSLERPFGAGHSAHVGAGAVQSDEASTSTSIGWVQAGVWIELPNSLFARIDADIYLSDVSGQRIRGGIGYRF